MIATLFDPVPPDPGNDATPAATEAGVNDPKRAAHDKPVRVRPSPALRRDAPSTSREAADRIRGCVGAQQAKVLGFIVSRGVFGATDSEIAAGVGIPIQSVNPRRGELADIGAIVLNGQRRPTPSNRPARVWVAREYAPEQVTPTPGDDRNATGQKGGAA